jgi:hypothetical protein
VPIVNAIVAAKAREFIALAEKHGYEVNDVIRTIKAMLSGQ